ncbi:mandelate racemase/muconate lactonizing enzyme family protein [Muricoccus aerilatus]|uniref:mandelate racemase/muconate lactonizing enzyme family protein n=1 Tax=Muricoccus aerilatus TaxID=452982 RepID=UPI000B14E960|nr:mandelate racemase/muconate lactonizing enzyme family protein [Roseomonas aerilata]
MTNASLSIARVTATPMVVEASFEGQPVEFSLCLVAVETRDGRIGHGLTAITEEEVVATAINAVAAPALLGENAMAHERIWEKLYWLLAPRGQTGYALHVIAAIDLALWDLKGKVLGQPVWRLLGAARDRTPVYATFGFDSIERDRLGEAAKEAVSRGFTRLKMTVGNKALSRRDEPRPIGAVIAEDALRIRAVRQAVGDEVELFLDANCGLDPLHAQRLARSVEECGITFFEEPITQNDAPQMAALRRAVRIPLACGQNEGLLYRFRDLLLAGAVDVLQPNVAITGGLTQCLRVAALAQAFNTPIANGGAWTFHNMHLHAGVAHGGLVEYHLPVVAIYEALFRGVPRAEGGWLALPEAPGFGFEPDPDAVRDFAARPLSGGRGKH